MAGGKVERRHSLFPDFNDLFNREFPGLPGWRPATAAHSIPVEVSSGARGYVLRAELPGMDPDDVTITVDDNLITVSAEHSESEEDKEHSEFRYGSFRRTVRLPVTIPADDVEASYEDGILTIRVPMPEEKTGAARTIPVKRGGTPPGEVTS
ncbi:MULTISPECIES: Hsp20/alpha crystallin family protein [unclassified Streptomyces]|uniref:Hsp20/alpha crystallin family protein n=1 Tax=unclassified Streptomyces TaxID=2593676 RepID=UPI0006F313CF|nr:MULTISPECIES: Hsp20/alpha crystallin family protein [unclassified Streptomyces]KQX46251.1 heat-shock protein Hsp20 [Streptomyces sp. Root1304]KRA81036.1 heat-shock protein Hsp20 [Streptomyces sp. Root66D1]